jgi:hypothetical protein
VVHRVSYVPLKKGIKEENKARRKDFENHLKEFMTSKNWKTQVLKVLEETPIERPKTLEKVEELRTEMYNHLLKPSYEFKEIAIKNAKRVKLL